MEENMEKKLRLTARCSWIYLILALVATAAVGFAPYFLVSRDLFVGLAVVVAIIYGIHWFYGAMYWPNSYRERMERGYTFGRVVDLSAWRGHIASLVSIVAFIVFLCSLKPDFQNNLSIMIWALSLALWLAVSFFLNRVTRTAGLFRNEELVIDLKELLPDFSDKFQKLGPDSDDERIYADGIWYERYYMLYFLVPASCCIIFGSQVDATQSFIRDMKAALKEQQAEEGTGKVKKEEATKISKEILEHVNLRADSKE